MANVNVFCFLISYAVAFVLEWTRLFRLTTMGRAVILLFAGAGFVTHTIYLLVRSDQTDLPPILSSPHDWVLVSAWLAIVLYILLTIFNRELAIGLFLLPLVLILIGSAYWVSDEPNALLDDPVMRQEAIRGWLDVHVSSWVFGITGVIAGFVLSMMYLVQHRSLKHKQSLQSDLSLPNLEKLARLNMWAVIGSVPLLFLGMGTGVYLGFLFKGQRPITFSDPIVIVNGVVLLLMVVFLIWLLRPGRPAGKRVAWLTIWAFGFLLLTLIGMQVLTGGGPFSLETGHRFIGS